MISQEFRKGDRVDINNRAPTHRGRKGTVTYASGNQCWIKFDDSEDIVSSFYSWWLNPLNPKDEVTK